MRKIRSFVPALGLSLSLLTACGGAAAPSAIETPAPAPVETAAVETEAPAETPAAAETPETAAAEAFDFIGNWQDETSQRAWLRVAPSSADTEKLAVRVNWGSSAWDTARWTMTGSIDPATGRLEYSDGALAHLRHDDAGALVSEEMQWEGSAGAFWVDETGILRWTDDHEAQSEGFACVRSEPEVPGVEELAEDYFRMLGGYHQGVSGASLAKAQAAYTAVRFASWRSLNAVDPALLRANLLAAWESLSGEEQAAFDGNFMDVVLLLDEALADYEANRGLFDNAGVGGAMAELAEDEIARADWRTLCSFTLTLGNSEE